MNINSDEENVLINDSNKVKDKYHLVYLIVIFTGIGVLIPWNFFITVKQYFIFKLNGQQTINNSTATNELSYKFENYLSIASMVPSALINILNLFLRRHITPMRRFSFGISIIFLVFLITLVFTKVDTEDKIMFFFLLTMISVVILNVCGGIIQGSSLGIISMMPGRYIKGFMEGQAISGLIASVANIITIGAVSSPDNSAFMYFFVAMVFIIITAIGFCRLGKLKFSRAYVKIANQMDKSIEPDQSNISVYSESIPTSSFGSRQTFMEKYGPIVKKIYWFGLTASCGFFVSLSLFPAICSQIETYSNEKHWKTYFSPVSCFLTYNVADYLGRYLCGFVKFPSRKYKKSLFVISLLRFIFVPLFFMCNIPKRKYFPIVFNHDAYPTIFTFLFGVTNGYIITLTLIYAPNEVEDRDKEAVGTLMSLFLCFGLAFGVGASFLYLFII